MRNLRLALFVTLTACAASKANIQIVTAEESLRQARESKADSVSEYEYTMATQYLRKAKEEAGYAEYRVADALARQAAEWADRATIAAEKRGKTDIRMDDFSEVPTVAPAPKPVPAPVPTGLEDILGPTAPPAPGEPVPPTPEPPPPPIEDPEEDLDLDGGAPK